MAYDEALATRIAAVLADHPEAAAELEERRMFGGLAFLVRGHLTVAVGGPAGLMVRCDPADTDDHVAAGAEGMVMRGRPMNGWLHLASAAATSDDDLARWVAVAVGYVATLPPKPARPAPRG